jgi:hypothetical protein
MGDRFVIDEERVASLSATRQGRVSVGGFAYQAAYAVARLASLASGHPVLGLDDIPIALRYDWAEDLDERTANGDVVFTQCKRIDDAGQPAQTARILIGLAPKLLWAQGANVRLRLVSPDPRFGRDRVRAADRPAGERDAVRTAAVGLLAQAPADGSDRALWQAAADAFGHRALVDALWERLEFVYAAGGVPPFDPAGALFPVERDGLNVLLSTQLADQGRQREVIEALRSAIHSNLVAFDPGDEHGVDLGRRTPRVVERADVLGALLPYMPDRRGELPFRVVDRAYLEREAMQDKEPFVARFPRWRDVVHGDDPTVGFVERDETVDLYQRLGSLLRAAKDEHGSVAALFVVGSPGGGKSTLTRRVAALLALDARCTVVDPGPRVDVIDDDEIDTMVDALNALARGGRPLLLLLDDPFFAQSSWPRFLRRLHAIGNVVVLGATPSLLFDTYSFQLPNSVTAETWQVRRPSDRERRRLAEHHGRLAAEPAIESEDLLVLAMEASAGEPFGRIIEGIWRTLNGGRAVDPTTLPQDLPWLVQAYLVVCYFHRYYVIPREPLLRAVLASYGSVPAAGDLSYRLSHLVSSQGWDIFRVNEPPAGRTAWAGRAIAATHARVARSAWEQRPVGALDVADWVVPSAVREPAGAFEAGQLAATLLTADPDEAARLLDKLELAWLNAIAEGDAEVRNLALFVGSGKIVDQRFPDFDKALRAAAVASGRQAWIAAYQLYLNSADAGPSCVYPTDLPLAEIIAGADFSVAEVRALKFLRSLPDDLAERCRARWRATVVGEDGLGLGPGALTTWLVAHDPAHEIEPRVGTLVSLALTERTGSGLLSGLLTRSPELSGDSVVTILAATREVLARVQGDDGGAGRGLAGAAVKAADRIQARFGHDRQVAGAVGEIQAAVARWQDSVSA